ncbi:hypothetical protein Dda_5991 [Drechslerella dactyloides]|uniref:HTH La-type RNA-binding domain-containing protein n=1 Tax=Drechslerella dactyloides TaxID=74499 RepID=A0AAD6IUW9_DREDA|nr:hypothetical protein Dda_5991 [Drechslerella dactyloides]
MTTAAPMEPKKPAFSYAAAASGKAKPSSSGLSTPDETKKPEGVNIIADSKKDVPDLSKLNNNVESSVGVKDSASINSDQPYGAATSSTKDSLSAQEDDSRSIVSGQEATGTSTPNEDDKSGKESGPDAKTKFRTQNLVDAPIPKENPWLRRKEAFDRNRAMQTETKKPEPPTMSGGVSSDKSSQTHGGDRRHGRQKSNVPGDRPPHQAAGGRRDGVSPPEKRGPSDGVKDTVKSSASSDDSSRNSRPAGRIPKGQQDETVSRDVSAPPAPPSMSDKSLWPTPEVAQDEEKREKREKEEKEKEREKPTTGARPPKGQWVAMAVTPNIIYDTPLPTRGSRGQRGGRTDRGGRTGQGSTRPGGDTDSSTTPVEPTSTSNFDKPRGPSAQPEQRGAQAATSDTRSRRPTITPSPPVESAGVESVVNKDSNEVKKDASPQVDGDASKSNVEEEPLKERKPSQQAQEDGTFVGQGVLPPSAIRSTKSEKPASFRDSRDQGSHRASFSGPYNHKQENDQGNSSHMARDRPSGRGGFRGGRGDSNNSFVNHSNSRFAGGNSIRHHSPPSQINTNHHQTRQSPQYPASPSTPQTGRNYRQNSRSHGVQQSQQFGKYAVQNGYPPQSPFVQSPSYYPYYNARNGVNQGVPMHPDFEFTAAVQNVMNQLNYYFSFDNMVKDTYLRSHMDSQGWIFLEVIANFRKVKEMTKDNKNIVREACLQSSEVEFRSFHPDGRERLRSARNPTEWVLKYGERDETCRHEGPIWDPRFTHAQPQYISTAGGPNSYPVYFPAPNMPPVPVGGPPEQQFPVYNGYPQPSPAMMPGYVPGQEFVPENGAAYGNGFVPTYPPYMHGPDVPPTNGLPVEENPIQGDKIRGPHKKYPTIDEFSEEDINQLVLVLRKNPAEAASQENDGAQGSNIMVTNQLNDALIKLEQGAPRPPKEHVPADFYSMMKRRESKPDNNNNHNSGDDYPVKFCPTSPRLGASSASQKPNSELGWFVAPISPEEPTQAPTTTMFSLHSYPEFKNRVLGRRERGGAASAAELDILYRFFSHFLRNHFNLNMYNEFKSLALEDFHNGYPSGVEYLYKFHVYKIQEFPTPDLFFQDFAIFASDQNHEKPPYDKRMVDAVGHNKNITYSTKTRLGRFMQEKNKNFQIWPSVANHPNHHGHHGHHHYGGNHNNHGHQNSGHAMGGAAGRN